MRRTMLAGTLALGLLPGAVLAAGEIATVDLVLTAPDGRTVPVRVTWPKRGRHRLPLVVLSHGANGTLDGLAPLQHALTRERIVAAPRHPDSEANPDVAKVDRALLFGQRVADMRLILESQRAIETATGKAIDGARIAAVGHSYGALIAQALGGAVANGRDWHDPRVTRVVAFSPPGPFPGLVDAAGWAAMTVPQFVATGTADVVPPIAPTWQAHMVSFGAAHVGGSALWVGNNVDHYFGNRIQRLSRVAPDQGAAFDVATGLADDFLRGATLRGRADAVTERLTLK